MARPKRLNDKYTIKSIESFFSKQYHRGHKRYTYIEFADNKQIAIDRFKIKLLLAKDMKVSIMAILDVSQSFAEQVIEDDPIAAFMLSNNELTEDIKPIIPKIDPLSSKKDRENTHKKALDEIKIKTGYGKGILKDLPEKELNSKLADALYIFDCKKFDLTNTYIQHKLEEYYHQPIKIKTIQKYFNETYELFQNIKT